MKLVFKKGEKETILMKNPFPLGVYTTISVLRQLEKEGYVKEEIYVNDTLFYNESDYDTKIHKNANISFCAGKPENTPHALVKDVEYIALGEPGKFPIQKLPFLLLSFLLRLKNTKVCYSRLFIHSKAIRCGP